MKDEELPLSSLEVMTDCHHHPFRNEDDMLLLMAEIRRSPPEMYINLENNGINYLSTGAGFQPSTVGCPWK